MGNRSRQVGWTFPSAEGNQGPLGPEIHVLPPPAPGLLRVQVARHTPSCWLLPRVQWPSEMLPAGPLGGSQLNMGKNI